MTVPLQHPGDGVRTMSRIPFGGFAVLDIARPPRPARTGALSRKRCLFLLFPGQIPSTGRNSLPCDMRLSSRGLDDFDCSFDGPEILSGRQSVRQMEASFPLRLPIMHRVDSGPTHSSANRSTTEPCPAPVSPLLHKEV